MREWFKKFFSISNEINENTVIGVTLLPFFLIITFLPIVGPDKYYTMAGLIALFFGLGAMKK